MYKIMNFSLIFFYFNKYIMNMDIKFYSIFFTFNQFCSLKFPIRKNPVT